MRLNFLFRGMIIPVLLFFFLSCKKEDPPGPAPHIIFEEYFDDNSNKWPEFDEEAAAASISDGMYYFRHKNTDTNFFYSIYMYKDFPYSDYRVETGLECVDPGLDFRYGIQWFRKDNYNYYYMLFREKSYMAGYVYNYNYHILIPWTSCEQLKESGGTNDIDLLIQGQQVEFILNGIPLTNLEVPFIVGDEFGFILIGAGEIGIDYVKITR